VVSARLRATDFSVALKASAVRVIFVKGDRWKEAEIDIHWLKRGWPRVDRLNMPARNMIDQGSECRCWREGR